MDKTVLKRKLLGQLLPRLGRIGLKELYSSLMHVTCVAHLLHNCAMRAHFNNIDEIIATIKAATIKNKDCKKDFYDAGLPSPPDPVITRWATWLRARLTIFLQ